MTRTDKIVFMGTPEFSAEHLKALIDAGRQVAGVVTQPDRPSGRGRKQAATPVKKVAEEHGIPVIQPASLRKDPGPMEWLKKIAPDLIVVTAYGLIIPAQMLDAAPGGGWNIHASLLPRYRGVAPIQWAVVNGETQTGITLMQMNAGMDTGDIILQKSLDIGPEETAGELTERLIKMGISVMLEGLKRLDEGAVEKTPQEDSRATYAPLIKKEDRDVDWNDNAVNIHNRIRGFNPKPGARSGDLKLLRSKVGEKAGAPPGSGPGTVTGIGNDGIRVATGEGELILTEVQPPGGRAMSAADYANGRHLKPGEMLK